MAAVVLCVMNAKPDCSSGPCGHSCCNHSPSIAVAVRNLIWMTFLWISGWCERVHCSSFIRVIEGGEALFSFLMSLLFSGSNQSCCSRCPRIGINLQWILFNLQWGERCISLKCCPFIAAFTLQYVTSVAVCVCKWSEVWEEASVDVQLHTCVQSYVYAWRKNLIPQTLKWEH